MVTKAVYRHLYEIVTQRAKRLPDAVAFGSQHGLIWQTITSQQLLNRVNALASQLNDRGVQEGDRVILWVPSSWWSPVYYFAVWKLGAIVVPFDREMNSDAAARIVELVEPRLIIVGFGEKPTWANGLEATEWWEPSTELDRNDDGPALPAEELAVIAFTSGTTGQSQGLYDQPRQSVFSGGCGSKQHPH